ncbi:hypothetical protein [Burkholderia ambifaria]|uniref:hypothetical protein n=1 Tax=Burkholderia ambifaria TaxID=152480 RepID=UPI000F80E077|nr:hypothetical protein [Burkholderia ambifaria]
MLLISMLLGLPWELTVPAYFAIGTLWACFYLPRCVKLMASDYAGWRSQLLGSQRLQDILGADTQGDGARWTQMRPDTFLNYRDHQPYFERFTERRVLAGFIANVAFWPIRIPQKVLTDYLRAVWSALARLLRLIWRALVRAVAWAFNRVLALYGTIIRWTNREAIADLKKLEAAKGGRR